jgi:hypothetical protein
VTQNTVAFIFAFGAVLVMVIGYNLPKVRTIFFAIGFFTLTSAFFANYSNWLPQVRGEVPEAPSFDVSDIKNWSPEQLRELGEITVFGRVVGGAPTDADVGKGQCPLCHTVDGSVRRDRGPSLKSDDPSGVPIAQRGEIRLADARYQNPGKQVAEAKPGSGRATNIVEYIAESHVCPSCFVVTGFGEAGSNDTKSPMPPIHKKPIELSIEELVAVDTFLYMKDGIDPPSYSEIEAAYLKFIPDGEVVAFGGVEEEGAVGDPCKEIACPGDDPIDVIAKMGCAACHKIPSVDFATTGAIGPLLTEGHNAPLRIKSLEYKAAIKAGTASAMTPKDYVIESIMSPSAFIVQGFEVMSPGGKSLMPHNFPDKFTYAAVSNLADFLLQQDMDRAKAEGLARHPLEK